MFFLLKFCYSQVSMYFFGREKLVSNVPFFCYVFLLSFILDGLPLLVSQSPGVLQAPTYSKSYFCIKFWYIFKFPILEPDVPSLPGLIFVKWMQMKQNFLFISKMHNLYLLFWKFSCKNTTFVYFKKVNWKLILQAM